MPPRALLIAGQPNTYKTTSLLSWAKAARPGVVHIISCPREAGHETIPLNNPLVVPHVIRVPYVVGLEAPPIAWKEIVESVEKRAAEILAGKHGAANTICVDGLQKYSEAVLGWMSGGRCFTEQSFNGIQVYPKAQAYVCEFMLKLMSAPINYVAFTTWADYEKDKDTDEDTMDKGRMVKAPRHQWPDLMGKLAKRVVGMVSTVFADVQGNMGRWQTKAAGDVSGCGLKRPLDIVTKVPLYVPQDWPRLEALMYPETSDTGVQK